VGLWVVTEIGRDDLFIWIWRVLQLQMPNGNANGIIQACARIMRALFSAQVMSLESSNS